MPVREKAIRALACALDGPHLSFNVDGIVKLGALEMSRGEFYERYGGAYIEMIDSIDWKRVLLEASARHQALGHLDDGSDDYNVFDSGKLSSGNVCAECVCETLLATDFGGRSEEKWQKEPRSPRNPHSPRYPLG
jgi:hypothetical protein